MSSRTSSRKRANNFQSLEDSDESIAHQIQGKNNEIKNEAISDTRVLITRILITEECRD
jgi:hypothetical protein